MDEATKKAIRRHAKKQRASIMNELALSMVQSGREAAITRAIQNALRVEVYKAFSASQAVTFTVPYQK